ncbi:MAG: LysR family transcriptional regulator, partial [Bacteroidales bacterium]|nr:LysR family transcriptional regulator [Bacteroidales bacterium]
RNLNYSRTAQELGISQPSVSTHIKLLEEELKVKLFFRQGKGFCLTYSGELLLQKAEKILALYDEFHQEASLLSNVTEGSFKIGIPKAIYYGLFPEFAADWCRLSPKSSIVSSQGEDNDAVIKSSGSCTENNYLFTDFLLAVTPSNIKQDQYYDIAETKLLMYDGDPETSAEITARISSTGLNPQTLSVAATMKDPVSAIKFLLEYGKGSASAAIPLVSFLWKSQIADLLKKGILKTILLTEMGESVILRRNYSLYPADSRLLAFAKDWAKKKLLL